MREFLATPFLMLVRMNLWILNNVFGIQSVCCISNDSEGLEEISNFIESVAKRKTNEQG